jgi:hypothetical protein
LKGLIPRYDVAMRTRLAVTALLVAGVAPVARAGVTVNLDTTPGSAFAQQAGIDLAQVRMQLENELNALFQTLHMKDYLRAFSDAQSFTTRGLGVDYATNLKLVEVGIAANVAMNGNKAITEGDSRTQPVAGVATNITAMAGLNFGFAGLPQLTLFGNYFSKRGTYREFGAHLQNYGAHLQLKLFAPRSESLWGAVVQWGGIAITSGFDHAHMKLSLGQRFLRNIPLTGGQAAARIDTDSTGTFEMDMRTWSVPIEITTSLRLLSLLTAYGGAGFDFQFGSGSDLRMDLTSQLTGVVPSQNQRVSIGTATITATEKAGPSTGQIRGILGVQANLFFLKIFTQLNLVPDPFVASIAVGARLAY